MAYSSHSTQATLQHCCTMFQVFENVKKNDAFLVEKAMLDAILFERSTGSSHFHHWEGP